jgi:hypothetical protein
MANRIHESHTIEVKKTAWYEKKDAAFSDLIKSVRRIAWEVNLIFRKPIFKCFRKNSTSEQTGSKTFLDDQVGSNCFFLANHWFRTLIEHLTA